MDSLSLKGRRSSNASSTAEDAVEGNANDTSQLDKEEGNVLMSIISQCKFVLLLSVTITRFKVVGISHLCDRALLVIVMLICSAPWYGPYQDRLADVRARASKLVGESDGFLQSPRIGFWVSFAPRSNMFQVKADEG